MRTQLYSFGRDQVGTEAKHKDGSDFAKVQMWVEAPNGDECIIWGDSDTDDLQREFLKSFMESHR